MQESKKWKTSFHLLHMQDHLSGYGPYCLGMMGITVHQIKNAPHWGKLFLINWPHHFYSRRFLFKTLPIMHSRDDASWVSLSLNQLSPQFCFYPLFLFHLLNSARNILLQYCLYPIRAATTGMSSSPMQEVWPQWKCPAKFQPGMNKQLSHCKQGQKWTV